MLDYTDLGGRVRNRVLRALVRLSQSNKIYPDSIEYIQVYKMSMQPVAGTSRTDIYTCEYAGQKCAIKIFRRLSGYDDEGHDNNHKKQVLQKLDEVGNLMC
jgi:hypothetical protein